MSSSLVDVPTPALLIDADQVLVNARRMLDTARARGLSLRPNIKVVCARARVCVCVCAVCVR